MTDAREVLAEIQRSLNLVSYVGAKYALEAENAGNARRMHAALSAVLDLHKPYDYPALGVDIPGVPERVLCGGDHGDDLGTEYPCETVKTITEALT